VRLFRRALGSGRLALRGAAGAILGMLLLAPPGGAGVGRQVPSPGDAWKTYGGTLWNSYSNPDSAVTAATAARLQLSWRVAASGEVSGNPVVAGNRVFFGTWSGDVYAVARDTGGVLWTRSLGSSPINGGPLYDGGRLFIAASGGQLYCLSPEDSTVLWRVGVLEGLPDDALRASPRAYAGTIYESLGGKGDVPRERGGVAAVDEQTGRILWRTDLVRYTGGGAAVFSPPAVIPDLGALMVATGNPVLFPADPVGGGVGPAARGSEPFSESVVALSLRDGRVLWAQQTHPHDVQDFDFLAAPNVIRLSAGRLAVGAGEKDGTYYLFDARTGKPIWSTPLGRPRMYTLIVATAAVAGDRIYLGIVDIPGGLSSLPENYQAPAKGRLVALDARSGRLLWSDSVPHAIAAAPVAGRDVVFAVEADGRLIAVDGATGRMLWTAKTGGTIWNAEAGLALVGGALFVPLAHPGGVVAYRLP
jgi:polyvinyl alcohol dehydrogenase (cytochrome)